MTEETGSRVIFFTAETRSSVERLRSRTWVAPSDLRKAVFLREAVVMIGEKPDNVASCKARGMMRSGISQGVGGVNIPY